MSERLAIPDVLLERYLAGELSTAERARIAGAVERDSLLLARLQELERERAEFLAAQPPGPFAHRVAVAVAHSAPPEGRRGWPRLWLLAPSSAAALGILLAVAYVKVSGSDKVGDPFIAAPAGPDGVATPEGSPSGAPADAEPASMAEPSRMSVPATSEEDKPRERSAGEQQDRLDKDAVVPKRRSEPKHKALLRKAERPQRDDAANFAGRGAGAAPGAGASIAPQGNFKPSARETMEHDVAPAESRQQSETPQPRSLPLARPTVSARPAAPPAPAASAADEVGLEMADAAEASEPASKRAAAPAAAKEKKSAGGGAVAPSLVLELHQQGRLVGNRVQAHSPLAITVAAPAAGYLLVLGVRQGRLLPLVSRAGTGARVPEGRSVLPAFDPAVAAKGNTAVLWVVYSHEPLALSSLRVPGGSVQSVLPAQLRARAQERILRLIVDAGDQPASAAPR